MSTLNDIREAALEAQVDDIDSYADAILRLATDESFYRAKMVATHAARDHYFDSQANYGARRKSRSCASESSRIALLR